MHSLAATESPEETLKRFRAPEAELETFSDEVLPSRWHSTRGRLCRTAYAWRSWIGLMLTGLSVAGLVGSTLASAENLHANETIYLEIMMMAGLTVTFLYGLFLIFVNSAQRLHDLNFSGLFALLFIVPFINQILHMILIFWPATNEENRFGHKREPSKFEFIAGSISMALVGSILIFSLAIQILDFVLL